jgi:hypothetical protein
MITVVELPEFIKRSERFLKENERENIVNYLAAHPAAGAIIKGREVSENYVGKERVQVRVVVFGSSTITTTSNTLFFF